VYSLGKTLEFVFSRAVPTQIGPSRCLRGPSLSSDLWDELDAVLERSCAYDPRARYRDAAELLAAIPEVVLVRAAGTPPKTAVAADVALGSREIRVLTALFAQCPTDSDEAQASELARRSRVSPYAFAMAFRELRRLGFIETRVCRDYDDNTWEQHRPSTSAFEWARVHPDEMEPPSRSQSGDDDIPF
jgi:hypothetical protein